MKRTLLGDGSYRMEYQELRNNRLQAPEVEVYDASTQSRMQVDDLNRKVHVTTTGLKPFRRPECKDVSTTPCVPVSETLLGLRMEKGTFSNGMELLFSPDLKMVMGFTTTYNSLGEFSTYRATNVRLGPFKKGAALGLDGTTKEPSYEKFLTDMYTTHDSGTITEEHRRKIQLILEAKAKREGAAR